MRKHVLLATDLSVRVSLFYSSLYNCRDSDSCKNLFDSSYSAYALNFTKVWFGSLFGLQRVPILLKFGSQFPGSNVPNSFAYSVFAIHFQWCYFFGRAHKQTGPFFCCKNTGIRRAKRRTKFKFLFKKINCAVLHQNEWAIEFSNLQLDWMICYIVNNCVPFPQNEFASVFSHRWMIYCIANNCVTSLQYEWSSVLSSAVNV